MTDTKKEAKPKAKAKKVEKVIKTDIAKVLQDKLEMTRIGSIEAVDIVIDTIKKALYDNKTVELRGFGVFKTRGRRKGNARNLQTGETVPIPTGKTVRFKPGKELKDLK